MVPVGSVVLVKLSTEKKFKDNWYQFVPNQSKEDRQAAIVSPNRALQLALTNHFVKSTYADRKYFFLVIGIDLNLLLRSWCLLTATATKVHRRDLERHNLE